MEERLPGFGIAPVWRGQVVFGTTLVVAGIVLGFVLLMSGAALGLLGGFVLLRARTAYAAFRADADGLAHDPPTPCSTLTAQVLGALNSTPADLAANRQGTITPTQWQQIRERVGTVQPPRLQSVAGPVILRRAGNKHRAWEELVIGDLAFTDTYLPGLFTAFKRTAAYRLYFIEAVSTHVWRRPVRVILAVEALADA